MGAHSKRQAILLGLEDRRIDARDLLQVLERRELAVLRAVRDDRRGLRAPQRQAALQLDRRRRVHIDSRQLLRRKAGREILEHGPELLVRAPGAERAHLPERGRPPGAILADRHHDVRGMTLRAQLDGLLAARPRAGRPAWPRRTPQHSARQCSIGNPKEYSVPSAVATYTWLPPADKPARTLVGIVAPLLHSSWPVAPSSA